ncbi:hypothetical protein YC2023_066005 [Brassica napus]
MHVTNRWETKWLSISTHISTLVLGLSTLALPVDCLGYFGPRGLSVQYTQDVRGCPPAHRGRPWLSVSTHRTSVAVRVCPCVTLVLGLSTLAHPVDCLCDFGPRGLSVQHTQDVCGTHMTSVAVHQYTYQHAGPWISTLSIPVDCLGDFGPRGVSVQYTQDVRGCPPAHTGCSWLFVAVRQHTQDVSGCPSVYISARWSLDSAGWPFPWTVLLILAHVGCLLSTHRMSVGVRQHTQDVRGCPWLSISTHRTSMAVRVCPCVSVCVRQHTQDVRCCLWLCVSTHRTSVAVHQYTHQQVDRWTQHADYSRGLFGLFWPTWAVCSIHIGRPSVSASTHRTSVAVRQHIQDVRGCLCVSVFVRSTHMTSVAVHQYTYQHAGPWTQHAGPSRGLFG